MSWQYWIGKKICLYTCNYGNYDRIGNSVQQDIDCDYLYFTDNPAFDSKIYRKIVYEPLDFFEGKKSISAAGKNMANTFLCRSNLFLMEPLKGYDICIYLDANCTLSKRGILRSFLKEADRFGEKVESEVEIILSKHPLRSCLYEEANASLSEQKYFNTDLQGQALKYSQEGCPKNNGLYWNGFIAYLNPFVDVMKSYYDLYTQEGFDYVKNPELKFHIQGQVSLPYVIWKLGWEKKVATSRKYFGREIKLHAHLR